MITGSPKEIAALILAIQGRREPVSLELNKAEHGDQHVLTIDDLPYHSMNNLPPDTVLRELGAK